MLPAFVDAPSAVDVGRCACRAAGRRRPASVATPRCRLLLGVLEHQGAQHRVERGLGGGVLPLQERLGVALISAPASSTAKKPSGFHPACTTPQAPCGESPPSSASVPRVPRPLASHRHLRAKACPFCPRNTRPVRRRGSPTPGGRSCDEEPRAHFGHWMMDVQPEAAIRSSKCRGMRTWFHGETEPAAAPRR